MQTANVYRQVAQQRGFTIIRPEHTRNESDDLTDGYIRVINSLSVDPEKSTKELYDREFKNLIRLLNFGENKIKAGEKENPMQGQIHILAFGQEATVIHALNKYFERDGMRNLEVIDLAGKKNPKKARARFRWKAKNIK